ncbi:MAG TPA: TlpA disulfide reductase family protein [Chthonomonadaceae bacterium]|nr:TlpA disulfide reductase family protein [Chthonomonadaceae bacterium]
MAAETASSGPRAAGSPVVDFELGGTDGKTYSSREARERGLLLAVFFKVGCGTCKYSVPFLQRFHEQYAQPSGGKFQIWGISQDNREDTLAFARENGNATFPLLLDETLQVSESYGLVGVPDLYLMGADAAIQAAVLGHFGKDGFNELAQKVAAFLGVPYVPVVREEDDAPALKPG